MDTGRTQKQEKEAEKETYAPGSLAAISATQLRNLPMEEASYSTK